MFSNPFSMYLYRCVLPCVNTYLEKKMFKLIISSKMRNNFLLWLRYGKRLVVNKKNSTWASDCCLTNYPPWSIRINYHTIQTKVNIITYMQMVVWRCWLTRYHLFVRMYFLTPPHSLWHSDLRWHETSYHPLCYGPESITQYKHSFVGTRYG